MKALQGHLKELRIIPEFMLNSNQVPIIRGLTKVRDEEHIIKDTLLKWKEFCTGGIYVYDDVSEDSTVDICRSQEYVRDVIVGDFWDPDREKAEWFNRQIILSRAQQDAGPNDWFVYFDADEHPYNFSEYTLFNAPGIKAVAMRLYDFYITPEDVDLPYNKREWIGPEFRTIPMFFKNSQALRYHLPDQRVMTMPEDGQVAIHGDIKHYGKAFSVQKWEETCDYYIRHWPKYSDKWRKRKGKAVHEEMLSDFGNPLIRWKDRAKGFSLETQHYGRN